jgi:hypothetical protein
MKECASRHKEDVLKKIDISPVEVEILDLKQNIDTTIMDPVNDTVETMLDRFEGMTLLVQKTIEDNKIKLEK